MFLIKSDNTDVNFNLATEDYLLHNFTEDIVMIWQSQNAVVCGKHQNICAEINFGFCIENNIQTARRLSGGGTVYHDKGNVNFTFIQKTTNGLENAINFRRFLNPVCDALLAMGVNAEYNNRNDLTLNGKKISGNAEHLFQKEKKVLHHGTLLFDSDLTNLGIALKSLGNFYGKAVKSVRSEVTNIKNSLPHTSTSQFIEKLCQYWEKQPHTNRYVLCEKDVESILDIQKKYNSLEWTVHYSPRYKKEVALKSNSGTYQLELDISEGTVENLRLKENGISVLTRDLNQFSGSKQTLENSVLLGQLLTAEIEIPYQAYLLF